MSELYKPTTAGLARARAVVPNDSFDLTLTARSLWVGTAGDIAVILAADDDTHTAILHNVPVGLLKDVYIRRILATGTTASGLVALT